MMEGINQVLIVGYGEIGKPLFEVVRRIYSNTEWLDIQDKHITGKPDIMHIAFPEDNHAQFVSHSVEYVRRFSPRMVLIESTVRPGTTMEIYHALANQILLCHSPVRGNITEGMIKGLFQYTKFIGPTSSVAADFAKNYYTSLGIKATICQSPLETELGKLFETTYRGLMMTWFQEIHRICKTLGGNYEQIVEIIGSTEREGRQARPIFHPGVVGGHCIIPNAEKLASAYRSQFVEALLQSNKERQKELSG